MKASSTVTTTPTNWEACCSAWTQGNPDTGFLIDGDVCKGTATLKSAVALYRDFRKGAGRTAASSGIPEVRRPRQRQGPGPKTQWPAWPHPKDEDLLELARTMAPFVRFLDPGIVDAVVEDNRRFGSEWSTSLEALGTDPAIYLWEGSPCAFPGVRRYAGSTEIAAFRKRTETVEAPPECLSLDDNDYPKHLWAFVFTGKPFRKRGPAGCQLAHLFDHKVYGNRWPDEFDAPPGIEASVLPYGLFTSAANSVYAPGVFLRPNGPFSQAAEPDPETGASALRPRLLPGSASLEGKALRRSGLDPGQLPVERARGSCAVGR